jgi:hypothetical protein
MTGSSGLIIKELVLPREEVDSGDPYSVIQCNIDFLNYLFETARYLPGEIIPEPIWSYEVDYYLAQVNNGGHGQYVGNSGIITGTKALAIEATKRGLAAMGADDYGAIYADLLAVLASSRELAEQIATGAGFGEIPPVIKELDRRFFALDGTERLIAQNRAFLLGLKNLRLVPSSAWKSEMDRLARLNPNGAERTLAAKRKNEERAARDPHVIMTKELCQKAGCVFVRWTARTVCTLDGRKIDGWFMVTDKGPAVAFFLADEALLFNNEAKTDVGANRGKLSAAFNYTKSENLLATVKPRQA